MPAGSAGTLMGMVSSDPNLKAVSKLHPMAVLALICSCVFCCPFAPLAGVILGFFSWRGIAASQGRLRGRSLALLAMIVGLIMLPLQYFVSSRIEASQSLLKKEGFQRSFEIFFDTELPDRRLALEGVLAAHDGRRPSFEEVDQFVLEVEAQFGSFRGVSLIDSSPLKSNMLLQLNQECALYFSFEGGTTTGAARCAVLGTGWSTPYQIRISTLQINLDSGDLLELTPTRVSEPDPTPPSEGSSDE